MATQKEIDFLLEEFDYDGLLRMGFYTGISRKDYDRQIKRICEWFGFQTIFQYKTVTVLQDIPVEPNIKTFSEN